MENQNDLTHWGILGMKWGVRRYRNPDGSLTLEGKKRYSKYSEKADKYSKKMEELSGNKSTRKKLDLSKMSDQELRNFIYRTRLEQEYTKLYKEFVDPPKVAKGENHMKEFYDKAIYGLDMATKTVGLAKGIYDLKTSRNKARNSSGSSGKSK